MMEKNTGNNKMKRGDIDIDFQDVKLTLSKLKNYTHASTIKDDMIKKHQSGIYVQDIPIDPITGLASLNYKQAEEYGYYKIDFLSTPSVYDKIKSEDHIIQLLTKEPIWEMLDDEDIVKDLFHLGSQFELLSIMKPRNIDQLAMVLALKIPSKMYLIGKSWEDIEKEIWLPVKEVYFKKSHSYAYAHALIVQMNALVEENDI